MAEEQWLPVELPLLPGALGALLLGCSLAGAGTGTATVKDIRERRCAVLEVLLHTGLKAIVLLILWVKTDLFISDQVPCWVLVALAGCFFVCGFFCFVFFFGFGFNTEPLKQDLGFLKKLFCLIKKRQS